MLTLMVDSSLLTIYSDAMTDTFAYRGYVANPLQVCTCEDRKGDHYRGTGACLVCGECQEFTKKPIEQYH